MSERSRLVSCERAARWLYPALDGSLGDRETAALDVHLAACPSCRALRDREVAFRARIARLYAEPPQAPAALHARLRAALLPASTADPPREEAGAAVAAEPPPASSTPARTTRRRALGVLVAAVLVTGGLLAPGLVDPIVRGPSGPPALVRSVAAQQAALAEARLPLELRSQSSARIAAWLRARLRFPVDLPPLAGEGVEVIGTRLTELAAAEAAAVVYRIDGRDATLFTFPAAVLHSPELTGGGTEFVVDEHRFRHYRLPGLTVTLWERGAVGYALAAPADVAAGRGCALCHVGEENRRLERALAPDLGR